MKNKITPSVILLIITVIFFIAGIFFMGIQARQQISDTEQSLDAFISQVKDKQQAFFFIRCQRKKRSSELSPAKSFRSADCCAGASRYSGVIRSCHFRFQSGPQLIPEIFYKIFTIERTLTYRKDLYNEK